MKRLAATARPLAVLAFALSTSLLAGCRYEGPARADAAAVPDTPQVAEIAWFDGSVEDAFALAKSERRAVFLYWGAEWCPPCHALRTKLFTRPDFVARLGNAIPVYLDGDTDRAQIWGEKLGTAGYPTVIVLDPDGVEITRIAGTLPAKEYGDAVSRAIASTKPIGKIIEAVEAGGASAVPAGELAILAFHSYGQDDSLELTIERQRALFERLHRETPENLPIERSRFLTLELFALADKDDKTPVAALAPERRTALARDVTTLLGDPALRNANLDLVLYGSTMVVRLLTPDPGADRDALVAPWNEAALAIRNDESLSTDDRLTALLPRLRLAMLDAKPAAEGEEPAVPEAIRAEVLEGVKWAGSQVKSEDEMQAVMNTMGNLLESAGLTAEASALLSEKMSETTAPYYYMGWLASLEADAGNKEKAVDLYRQAWLSAKASGSASSMSAFRWGTSYLRQAMKLTPDKVEQISGDTETIVGDVLSGSDAFAGGNWSRLEGLGGAMKTWADESSDTRGASLEKLKTQVSGACERFPDEGPESGGGRCRAFLKG